MFAKISYRFPGREIIRREGLLERVVPGSGITGFILSPFKGDSLYVLKETEAPLEQRNFVLEAPVVISENEYLEIAREFLDELRSKKIGKAVLSRVKKVPFDQLKAQILFDRLCTNYPTSFVYLLESEELGMWIGASPEVLLQGQNHSCRTIALAGTISADGSQSWTDKERDEQRMVTEDIVRVLESNGAEAVISSPVEEVQAGPVCHLRTTVDFHFSGDLTVLAQRLQPTPAVSGYPRKEALDLIARYEQHERELYCGMIGEVSDMECSIYVNLRCARISGGHLYLYLGGGFTEASDVSKEWQETENKARTLLNIAESL